jgi:glyoxylase-like metal-dependent hydrolase (beta-lactamase superfamily II)
MGLVERVEHEGVEGLRIGRYGGKINTTCLLYRIGTTIIDTGPPNQWLSVQRFLQEKPIAQVIVTHHHEDHAGNLGLIAREFGCPTFAPSASLAPLAEGFHLQYFRRVIWGRPRARVQAQPIGKDMPLGPDSCLIPIATPGHSVDLTCYLEPKRGWLFAGDLFIAPKILYLRRDEDLGVMMESLRLIQRYDFDTVFCSHRGVVTSGKKALEKKLDYLEALCEQARALHSAGSSVKEISRRLLGKESLMSVFSAGDFTKRNLIEGCLRATPRTSLAPLRGDGLP